MALEPASETLPCGRDPLEAGDLARRGLVDTHARSCPYCQAAIASEQASADFTRYLKDQPVQVPDTLLPSVMKTVWSELRPGRNIPLPAANGAAFATEQAITSLLSAELDQLPDLLVHTCRIGFRDRDVDPGEAAPADQGSGLEIEVRVAAAYAVDLTALAAAARTAAAAALLTQFGLEADSIDIAVVDIYEREGSAR